MPAVSTSVMIGAIVTYLGNKLAKNESVNSFFDDFSEATVNWIKPLFIKEDDTPTRSLEKLSTNPNSASKQNLLKATLESELEDNPDAEEYIREIYEKISQSEEGKDMLDERDFKQLAQEQFLKGYAESDAIYDTNVNQNIAIQGVNDATISIVKDKIMR